MHTLASMTIIAYKVINVKERNYCIIESNDDAKIKRMAQKYAKFIAKNAESNKIGSYAWLDALAEKCSSCWCSICISGSS